MHTTTLLNCSACMLNPCSNTRTVCIVDMHYYLYTAVLTLCRRLLHRLMAEAVTVAEGTSSSSSSDITGDSSSQRLLQAQRQFHTDIKRYQPLFAQVLHCIV
jgi:hypothetical protein